MAKKNSPNIFFSCICVLGAICLVMSLALALVNNATEPVIAKAAEDRAERARIEVLPGADSFELLKLDEMQDRVTAVYKAVNGAGYVFMLTTNGYGGAIDMICGIDADGLITGTKVLNHAETAGLGSKIAGEEYRSQYVGQDASLSGVDAISGVTISSTAFKMAIVDAFNVLEMIKEAQ